MKLFKRILFILTLLPSSAMAIDLDYYVYGGFDVTVNAFLRISLIFNDGEYIVMFFVAAMFGILFGGMITAGKKLLAGGGGGGNDASIANFLILVLVGTAIFKALIIPKGTVHVYDPVVNRYQAVANVPDLIVFAAGITNKAERVLTEIVDNGSAHPRSLQGGGVGLEMLINSFRGDALGHEAYIQKSVNSYISDCLPPAESLSGYTFDLKDIRSETSDLKSELIKLKNPAVYTTIYTPTNRSGTPMSCTEAWDSHLNTTLSSPALYEEYVEHICAQSGFAIHDPSVGIAQMNRCKNIISDAQDLLFDATASGDYRKFMQDIMLSKSIVTSLSDSPGSALSKLANKDITSSGFASQIVSEQWLPAIKAVVFGVVLGLMPILALFIVTPLVFKAVHIMVGLMLWLALWGVTDAIVHGIAMDQVISMTEGVKNLNMSLGAILMIPDQATKGLAILGKAQSMGVILATFIAGIFFRISGYAFTQLSEKWQQDIDRFGDKAGQETLDPISRMETMKRHMDGQALMTTSGYMGMESFSVANQQMTAAPYTQAHSTNTALRNGGMSNVDAMFKPGMHSGGERAGEILQQQAYANTKYGGDVVQAGSSQGQKSTEMNMSNIVGQHKSFEDVAKAEGKSTSDIIEDNAYIGESKNTWDKLNYKNDVQANNPELDLQGAINKDRSNVSLEETSHNRIGYERNQQQQQLSNSDRILAAQKNQLIRTSDEIGKYAATDGSSVPYVDQAIYHNEKQLGHTQAEKREFNDRGVTSSAAGEMGGLREALSTIGTNKGIITAGEGSFIDGVHVSTAKDSLKGTQEIDMANMRETPLDHQLLEKAKTDEAREQAETTARIYREAGTGLSTDDLATAQALAERSELVLNEDQAEHVHENLGTTGTPSAIATEKGGLFDVKIDTNGNTVSSRGFSGNSGSKDNQLTVTNGTALGLGFNQLNEGSLFNAIENREMETRDEYQSLYKAMTDDDASKQAITTTLANELSSITDSRISSQDIIGHSEQISASIGTPGLVDAISPFQAEISANAYMQGQMTDEDTVNTHRAVIDSLFEQSQLDGAKYRDDFRAAVDKVDEQKLQEVEQKFASEKFAEYTTAYRDSLNDIAHRNANKFSDVYDDFGKNKPEEKPKPVYIEPKF